MTLFVDKELYDATRKQIAPRPISRLLEDEMRRHLAELGGAQGQEAAHQDPVDYEALTREYDRVLSDAERREKRLRKRKVFDDLTKLALGLGVAPKDLSGLDEVAPKLLEAWKGRSEDSQSFILFLETMRAKRDLERKMSEARVSRTQHIEDQQKMGV